MVLETISRYILKMVLMHGFHEPCQIQASAWQETSWKAMCCGGPLGLGNLGQLRFNPQVAKWLDDAVDSFLGSENDPYIRPWILWPLHAMSIHCRANDDWWMDLWLPHFQTAFQPRGRNSLWLLSIAPNHADREMLVQWHPMNINEWYKVPTCPKLEVLSLKNTWGGLQPSLFRSRHHETVHSPTDLILSAS